MGIRILQGGLTLPTFHLLHGSLHTKQKSLVKFLCTCASSEERIPASAALAQAKFALFAIAPSLLALRSSPRPPRVAPLLPARLSTFSDDTNSLMRRKCHHGYLSVALGVITPCRKSLIIFFSAPTAVCNRELVLNTSLRVSTATIVERKTPYASSTCSRMHDTMTHRSGGIAAQRAMPIKEFKRSL
jgi:hypothetical protein